MKTVLFASALMLSLVVHAQGKPGDIAPAILSNKYFDDGAQARSAVATATAPAASADIIGTLVDPFTKQAVTYTRVTTKPSGKPLTDADVLPGRGVYRKKGGNYYKLNYSLPLDVRYFGAVGDGKADDTQELQDAFDFCASLGITADGGSGLYRITKGLTANCSITFDAPTYGSNVSAGILVGADNITALTLAPGIKTTKNITIHGNGRKSNGIYVNNNFLSRHENIRVYNLNGFGFKGSKIYDTQFDNISVELCGSETEFAFSMLSSGDTWNMTIINRLQVEQSRFKAIFFDPAGLSCVINDVHSERTTGVPKDGSYSFVFGGNRCQYNTIRVQAPSQQKVLLTGSNTTYINCLFEKGLESVTAEGINGYPLTLIGAECQSPFTEKTNQIGRIVVEGGAFTRIQGYHFNAVYNDVNVGTFAFGFSNVPAGAVFRGCRIDNIEAAGQVEKNAAHFESCTINSIKDFPQNTYLINSTIKSAPGGNVNIANANVYMTGSTISGNVQVNNALLQATGSRINGDLTFKGGARRNLFNNLIVTGKVSDEFLAKPDISPELGMKHDVLGTNESWYVSNKGGKPAWTK